MSMLKQRRLDHIERGTNNDECLSSEFYCRSSRVDESIHDSNVTREKFKIVISGKVPRSTYSCTSNTM